MALIDNVFSVSLPFGWGIVSAVTALAFAALLLVLISKRRRDTSESQSRMRRDILSSALSPTSPPGSVSTSLSNWDLSEHEAQVDLLVTLRGNRVIDAPERLEELRDVLQGGGFCEILLAQLTPPSPPHRRGVATLLGSHPACPLPLDVLARRLFDDDVTVRLAAAASMENVGNDEAANFLIHALQLGALPAPRIIERLGNPWAVNSTVESLWERLGGGNSAEHTHMRSNLARALGLANSSEAIPVLLELNRVGSPEERIQAVRSLSAVYQVGTPSERHEIDVVMRAVLSSGNTDNSVLVHFAAQASSLAPREEDISLLLPLMNHSDWHVRRSAARALLAVGDEGVDALKRVLHGTDRYAADRAREELDLIGALPPAGPT